MHPFLDVSKLTDEEIIEKLGKAYLYMNSQVSLGHSPTVVSIREIVQSLEDERSMRLERNMADEFKRKYPKDLDAIELGKIDSPEIIK